MASPLPNSIRLHGGRARARAGYRNRPGKKLKGVEFLEYDDEHRCAEHEHDSGTLWLSAAVITRDPYLAPSLLKIGLNMSTTEANSSHPMIRVTAK
jgi:hypothetical protein